MSERIDLPVTPPEGEPIRNVVLRLPVFSLREARRQCIIMALQIELGDVKAAATLLQVSKSTLHRWMTDLNVKIQERYGD